MTVEQFINALKDEPQAMTIKYHGAEYEYMLHLLERECENKTYWLKKKVVGIEINKWKTDGVWIVLEVE